MIIPTSIPTRIREILFLGTGTSSCTPLIGCLVSEKPKCRVCLSAAQGPSSKNCRLNISSIIRFEASDGSLKNILIDCGKTFYTAALRWAVPRKLGAFEAVLLTHGHADAMLGLDDLRHWTGHGALQDRVDIWADKATMEVVQQTFPYLVDSGRATGGGFVSDLAFHNIEGGPFQIGGLDIVPIKVEHGIISEGIPYYCLGFLMDQGRFAYFSDVSRFPEAALQKLKETHQQIELLVLDCLREHRPYRSHFILADSIAAIREIKPKVTYLVGMAHDIEHDEFEAKLKELAPDLIVSPAHDGLLLQFEFDHEAAEISSV